MGGYGAGAGNQAANIANLGSGRIGDRRGFANREYGQIIQDQGFSAEVSWDLGFADLTSVTAYRDWVNDTGGDIDFTAADLWYRQDDGSAGFGFEVFTQEFRLAGTSGPVDWLVGMFYSDETLERRDKITLGPDFNNFWRVNSAAIWAVFDPVVGPANDPIDTALDNAFLQDRYEQTGNSLALFTHEIIELSPSTRLSVGLRYTSEEKDLTAQFSNTFQGPAFNGGRQFLYANRATIAGGAFNGVLTAAGEAGACNDFTSTGAGTFGLSISQLVYCTAGLNTALNGPVWRQSREENEFSGVLALQHEFSDDVSAYISASRGYKAGGFNLDRNFDGYVQTGPATYTIAYNTGFEPEMVDAYELGVKSAFFNRTLLANLAIFHNDYENFQLNTFNGISFQLTTIPEVISKGVELDLTWRTPIDGLTFQGGVAHTLARYGEDTGWVADSYNPYNRTLVLGRLPGAQLTNSPDWTVTGAATYERDLGGLSGLAYLDFRWMDDQVTGSDLNPAKLQPAYILVNARLGLYTQDERIGVELWARNLLDETAMQVSFDTPLQSGRPEPYARNYSAFLNDPRTVGITLRARY
jgi:outer membrane receptor protein involved in Fe transport